ncbi:hypothetical protein YDYSY3_07380 [Paenibacillus chitinolyticus]|nr:hypothetical protein YDYSY3_07380 [Paenibacillus chitinolyticus]
MLAGAAVPEAGPGLAAADAAALPAASSVAAGPIELQAVRDTAVKTARRAVFLTEKFVVFIAITPFRYMLFEHAVVWFVFRLLFIITLSRGLRSTFRRIVTFLK